MPFAQTCPDFPVLFESAPGLSNVLAAHLLLLDQSRRVAFQGGVRLAASGMDAEPGVLLG